MSAISLKNMWKRFYDPSLGQVETPQGVLSLPKLFLPFFLEMFLMNLMSTVNTFTLSFYSDQAVAAVGAAGQFMGMVMTFYSVISTGASIVISQNLGARGKGSRLRCFLFPTLYPFFFSGFRSLRLRCHF